MTYLLDSLSVWGIAAILMLAVIALLVLINFNKHYIVLLVVLIMVPAFWAYSDILGKPKPAAITFDLPLKSTVLSAAFSEGHAIYLWIRDPALKQPRYISLPWSTALAQALQAVLDAARENNTLPQMEFQGEDSLDNLSPKFYAPPQRAAPPKDYDNQLPLPYQHPEFNA